jgi:hypothetical protein
MLKSWGMYRSEGGGVLTFLGVISAIDADSALDKAERLLSEEPPDRLRAMEYEGPWMGPKISRLGDS